MLLAILVLYKERLEESKTFSSLFGASPDWGNGVHLLVYDNSPVRVGGAQERTSAVANISYVSDTSNSGVSKAYNKGFEIARRLRKDWLLLLDQDTSFPKGALLKYGAAIKAHGDSALFAPILTSGGRIYSPCGQILNANFPLRHIHHGEISLRGKSLLNSGMCIRVNAFEEIGGFDESIPLDFADHDFVRRYKQHFDRFVVIDVVCQHGFSDSEPADIDDALTRFGHYCSGARNYAKGVLDALSVSPIVFLRALRLSLRYRSLRFLRLLFRASPKR